MRIGACDPGLSGGLAVYEPGAEIVLADIPVFWEGQRRRVHGRILMEWLALHRPDVVFVEEVWAGPAFAGPAGFRFGRATGAIESAIQCAGIRMRLVRPQVWKAYHGLIVARRKGDPKPPKLTTAETKEKSRILAIRRFQEAAPMIERKRDHGRAEALLIAAYGAHVMSEQPMENRDAAGA
jgi:crossover junction endodeoxyribonuclease RuvC